MKLNYDSSVTFPYGFLANGVNAGIKENGMFNIGLIVSERTATAAAVFTKNKFLAVPILLSAKNLNKSKGKAKAIVVNSGCANALTGKNGMRNATRIVQEVAKGLRVHPEEVLIASTGVIGKQLPMESMVDNIPSLLRGLSKDGDSLFCQSILTTDKYPKRVAVETGVVENKEN